MFKNNILTAWRNLVRNRLYSFINISGLALGIGCAILIFCLLRYHLSFDNFHKDEDRIYRVVSKTTYDMIDYSQGIPAPFGKAFGNDYTYAEKIAMRVNRTGVLFSTTGRDIKRFKENAAYVEPEYFDIFNFPMLEGNAKQALIAPDMAIVTNKIAKKLFPNENAIGKQLVLNNKDVYTINGVLKDIPVNSDQQQQIYLSYANFKKHNQWQASDSSWSSISSGVQCFLKLKPGVKAQEVENSFPQLIKKYCKPADANSYFFYLQPLSSIHFDTRYDGKIEPKYLWALAFIGLFLVITACINFINLATAQSLNRGKEVGVRKTMGGSTAQMFSQIMAETAVLVITAILIGMGLAIIVLPLFNQLFHTEIARNEFLKWPVLSFAVVLLIVVTLLSGYYPSIKLAKFNPVEALKGKITQQQGGGISIRRVLIILQFTIVQLMIIASIVIAKQMRFSLNSDLGFNKDNILLIDLPGKSAKALPTLHNQLSQIPGISNISFCSSAPMSDSNDWYGFKFDNRPTEEAFQVNVKRGDDHYLSTFGLKLIAGHNITSSDTVSGYLVNETMLKKLNLSTPQEALQKRLIVNGFSFPIVGVIKDFHNESFHAGIDPICIFSMSKDFYRCAVRIPAKSTKEDLLAIQTLFTKTFPDNVFSYSFLDKDIQEMYESEISLQQLMEAMVGISIVIGCMGLYGLVSFMAVQRRKEIGVRKVLGASVRSVLWLFGREFSRLLIIAFLIAAPCAWLLMSHWLQDFVYRINIDATIFLLSLTITAFIATVAIGYTSLKASLANPIKNIRTE
ncbi:FtsX-like permease family protein [Mucilaginibacter gracilis]|uniref:FtsX-like permease family protein n=1 Tax=Mucilaginibacter gracilis TaxID=423350 RepID=A0A495J4U6_9SPHI|nr:ABC transporter permease [Mucilaginibacter gracilis]RKR83995.1 FtsX-like permease family protein [Mucilaginibacter gracilis]